MDMFGWTPRDCKGSMVDVGSRFTENFKRIWRSRPPSLPHMTKEEVDAVVYVLQEDVRDLGIDTNILHSLSLMTYTFLVKHVENQTSHQCKLCCDVPKV